MAGSFDQYVNDDKKSTLKVLSPFADASLCAENHDGDYFKIRNGDQFGLYSCNPEQRQDQQLVLTDGAFDPAGWGNIYIDGNNEHNVGISGSENNAGAGLIFWAADSSEIDQKFRVDIGTGIFALYNDNYDLCVSAPYASTSENIHSMPCSLSVAGNPYHQFFEAYKDSRNNYVFAVMRDNNLCLHATIYSPGLPWKAAGNHRPEKPPPCMILAVSLWIFLVQDTTMKRVCQHLPKKNGKQLVVDYISVLNTRKGHHEVRQILYTSRFVLCTDHSGLS